MAVDLDIPVWSFRANWKEGLPERLSFLTDVLRASEGAEQRRSLRETPRRTIEVDLLLRGPERTFFDLFLNRLGGGDMLVPLYWDIVTLKAPAIVGTTDRINFDNLRREFVPGYAIIMGKDAMTYEVVEIVNMDAEGIDLADPVTRPWPTGAVLMPLRRAVLDDVGSPSHVTAGVATATARFLIREANPWWPEIVQPRHDTGWRYKLEPFDTVGSDYSDPDYDDSAWTVGRAPFYHRGPPHTYYPALNEWGYDEATDIGEAQDVWMRRQLSNVAPGYSLLVNTAFDNLISVWIDGAPLTLTSTGGGTSQGIMPVGRSNPVICVYVDEIEGEGGGNFTFADVEVSQVPPGYVPPMMYQGRPVFLDEPNWVEALGTTYDREVIRLDTTVGLPYQVDSLGRALLGQSHRWFLPGREKLAAFRDLLYRNRGRARSFWLPTFKHDFRLVNSPGSGATQIVVENTGFRYVGGPTSGREYIAIKHAGGTIIRKIVSVDAGTTSATEKLNLDAPLGLALSPGQVRRISFADVARFDSDDFEITHHSGLDGLSECSATFRTFKNTRTTPEPIYYPIQPDIMTPFACGDVGPQIVLPRHSPNWRYLLEPYTTTGSNYSATAFNDNGWPVHASPFYYRGPPHPWSGITAWGYTGGLNMGGPFDVWMRRRFYCSPGYTLVVRGAFDNAISVWIDGVALSMGGVESGIAQGSIVATRSNPVVCVYVNETQGPGSDNFTFADIEITQVPPGWTG